MFDRNCQNRQNEFNTEFNADTMNVDIDMDFSQNAPSMAGGFNNMPTSMQTPIIEPMQERQVHRTFMHEVPHVCYISDNIYNAYLFLNTHFQRYKKINKYVGDICQM